MRLIGDLKTFIVDKRNLHEQNRECVAGTLAGPLVWTTKA